jgi:hypothetical protein
MADRCASGSFWSLSVLEDAVRKPKPLTPAQMLRKHKADARILEFGTWCHRNGLPLPEAEYRFASKRRWRFDFCWLNRLIALEVQGGLFNAGRHTRGAALLKEHEKLNYAAMLGYRVIFTTPQTLKSRETLATLTQLLT